MHTLKIVPLFLLLSLTLIGCSDSALQTASKDMLIISNAVSLLQTDVITANQAKLLDDQTTAKILQLCIKINVAGKQIDSVLKSISKLDPQSRSSIIALLTPISQALDPTQLEFIVGISNPETRQKVEGAFLIIRTTISGVQLNLAVSSVGGGS
jgi:hypothetical protein